MRTTQVREQGVHLGGGWEVPPNSGTGCPQQMWTGGRTEYSVQYEVISYCMSRSAEYFAHLPVQWAILRTVLCMVRLLGRTDRQGKGSGGAGWVGGKHVLEELDEPKSTGPCIGRGGTVRAVAMTGGEWLLSLERDGCPSSRTPCRITVGTDDTSYCRMRSPVRPFRWSEFQSNAPDGSLEKQSACR